MKQQIDEATAISETRKLWAEIAASGMRKTAYLQTNEGKIWKEKEYDCDCPLCELFATADFNGNCPPCPLVKQFGKGCYSLGGGYNFYPKAFNAWVQKLRTPAEADREKAKADYGENTTASCDVVGAAFTKEEKDDRK